MGYKKLLNILDYASQYQEIRNNHPFLDTQRGDHRQPRKPVIPSLSQLTRDRLEDNL
jgi:hypothetical protein